MISYTMVSHDQRITALEIHFETPATITKTDSRKDILFEFTNIT